MWSSPSPTARGAEVRPRRRSGSSSRSRARLLLATLTVSALVAVGPGGVEAAQIGRLVASDAGVGDRFGEALAAHGNVLVVGARLADDPGLDAGAAYVFERHPPSGEWLETALLRAPDAGAGELFGAAVAVSSDTVVVGAPFGGDVGVASGAVYIFNRSRAGSWLPTARITAPDAASGDEFGSAVAISGDTLIVGSPFDSDAGYASGSAYLFIRSSGGQWTLAAKLRADDAAISDELGCSVAINGGVAVAGAEMEDERGLDAGAVYVFERDAGGPGAWGQVAKLLASDGAGNDRFGHALALGETVVAVGAPWHDAMGSNAGALYLFERDPGGNWPETAKLVASGAQVGAWFGRAVAAANGLMVAGAELEDGVDTDSGAAYVFHRAGGLGGGWTEMERLDDADGARQDALGRAVAGSVNVIAAGAPEDDDIGLGAGAVYLFRVDALTLATSGTCPGEVSIEVAGGTPNGLLFVGWSPTPGSSAFAKGPCAGTALGLDKPRLLIEVRLDGAGRTAVQRALLAGACGLALQAVDATSCATSTVDTIPGGAWPRD